MKHSPKNENEGFMKQLVSKDSPSIYTDHGGICEMPHT